MNFVALAFLVISKSGIGSIVLMIIPFAFIALIAFGMFALNSRENKQEEKRRKELDAAVAKLGLHYHPQGSRALKEHLRSFKYLRSGNWGISDLIEADFGEYTLAIFQYSGKAEDFRSIATYLQSDRLRCPVFRLRPETAPDRVGATIGFQDIDFASHPDFSDMFVVKGPDEQAVRDYLQPARLKELESYEEYWIEAQPGSFIFISEYQEPPTISPANLDVRVREAHKLLELMADD